MSTHADRAPQRRELVAPPAPESSYAELHTSSNFTFLQGGSHAEELVATAKALGLTAIAVTDRNTLAGVARAHLAARDAGMRLVIGARLDLTDAPSLLCYPTNRAAYGRLSRLISLGQRRAEKGQCLLTLEDVAAHAEGQIFIALPPDNWDFRTITGHTANGVRATSADGSCGTTGDTRVAPAQRPPAPLEPGSRDKRRDDRGREGDRGEEAAPGQPVNMSFGVALTDIAKTLSPAPVYLAASMLRRGIDQPRLAALAQLAQAAGTPLVATGDVLYHTPARRPLQDVLTCIRHGRTLANAGFLLEANAERHLKSPMAMARLFRGYEDAVARTAAIADACQFSLQELVYEYPDEPVPPGMTPQSRLEELTWEGATWRYPDGVPAAVEATLRRELDLIAELKYAPYFLTVHDIVQFARSRKILCQGRGSAANSAVCFCIGITSVNPTEVDLLFERFISPERKEPPDIDVDFEHERREEVIQYIYARYGRDRAGLAATVISYRARSAVREVGKAFGLSADTVAALAGMVWGTRSGGVLPEQHVREAGLDPTDPLLVRVLELTHELMGFPRHLSQHVGGFVLTRGPLCEVVPIGNAAMEDRTVIEWDKDDLDALGLLKVDVLALGMLTCIRKSFEFLQKHYGVTLSLGTVPRDDPAVYDMLCKADSVGVFQVESRAQMNMLPRLKPRTFYDLVIEVAIVRPGPIQGDMVHPYLRRRSGLEPEVYPSPAPEHGPPDELRQILGKTRGVPLFQEQAMRIAMVAARFSSVEANELRRAMATFRRRGTIGLLEEKMVSRMTARGYDPAFAQRCFDQIKGFGEYGFPESHAASFALLVYVSSWLKCHYPDVFAAALLNSQPMGFYAPAQIVRDAREHGVAVRPADVNHSDWDATLEPAADAPSGEAPWAMRLGLRQVDGLKQEEIQRLTAARDSRLLPGHTASGVRATSTDGACGETGETRLAPTPLAVCPVQNLSGSGPSGQDDATPFHPSRGSAPMEPDGGMPVPRLWGGANHPPFRTLHDIRARAGTAISTLERLAAADTFRSMGLDRRQALWEVRALPPSLPLPLFEWGEARDFGTEPETRLPEMPLSEHVVNDYQTLRLSLKAHPLSFLRERLAAGRVRTCAETARMPDGARVTVAGVVLVRQRPGSAKGVVFMTLEDETGVANTVVWPQILEAYRRVVMGSRLIVVDGRIQRHEGIVHVVCKALYDRSDWLALLSEDALPLTPPIARADEVLRPEPGSARGAAVAEPARLPQQRIPGEDLPGEDLPGEDLPGEDWGLRAEAPPLAAQPSARHPRAVRVLPKSRDFH